MTTNRNRKISSLPCVKTKRISQQTRKSPKRLVPALRNAIQKDSSAMHRMNVRTNCRSLETAAHNVNIQRSSCLTLEKLVRSSGVLPPNQHSIRITVPNGTTYEMFQPADHPGWDGRGQAICQRYGEDWYQGGRSALLIVPSIPARVERNILINLQHPDAAAITHELPEPVWWDDRLFGS